MSLPPYKRTRNPTLEKEDEYIPSSVPLIIHSGVVETRKTTDKKLVRSQPSYEGVEFEYIPMFSTSGSTVGSLKSKSCISEDKKEKKSFQVKSKYEKLSDEKKLDDAKENKTKNKIEITKNEINDNESEVKKETSNNSINKKQSCKSVISSASKKREGSAKSNASKNSLVSRQSVKSVKSAITEASVTSTVRNVITDKKYNRRTTSTTGFRYIANGLDEEDLFPHRRR